MTKQRAEDDLDVLFAAARKDPPLPSDAFTDHMRQMAVAATPMATVTPDAPTSSAFAWLRAPWIWSAGTAFASALVVGVFVGINPPTAVLDATAQIFETPDLWDVSGYGAYGETTGDLL